MIEGRVKLLANTDLGMEGTQTASWLRRIPIANQWLEFEQPFIFESVLESIVFCTDTQKRACYFPRRMDDIADFCWRGVDTPFLTSTADMAPHGRKLTVRIYEVLEAKGEAGTN